MDLVDIDKVLNDLELNEGNIANHTLSSDIKISENNEQQQQNVISKYNVKNNVIDNNVKYTTELDRNKRFVAVSQVLSSLDDYCRDVNTLKLDFNNKETIKNDDNTDDLIIKGTEQQQAVSIDNLKFKNLKSTPDTCETVSANNPSDGCSSLINDKQIQTNDKDKNNYDNCYLNDDNDDDQLQNSEYLTNSSITTSSPSSFSSGPSPGCADNSCDLSISASIAKSSSLVSNEQKRYEDIENKEMQQKGLTSTTLPLQIRNNKSTDIKYNENKDLTIPSSSLINNRSDNNINNKLILLEKDNDIKNDESNKLHNINDFCSSSISSCPYNENTLSSLPEDGFMKNFDYEQNLSTSITNQLEIPQNEKINSVTSNDNCENLIKCDDKEDIEINEKYNVDKKNEIDKVTVTFGSTMDEISDTELDSMLQEIDIELQNQQQQQTVTSFSDITCTNNENNSNIKIASPEEDDESVSSIGEVTISSSSSILGYNFAGDSCVSSSIGAIINSNASPICPDTHNTVLSDSTVSENYNQNSENENISKNSTIYDSQQHEIEDNLQNADSFSQASTVEFTDVRFQNDFGNCSIISKNDNNIIDGLTTHNNSNNNFKDINVRTNNESSSIDNTINKKKDSANEKLGDKFINGSEQKQLQRPNSLDLPSQQCLITSVANEGTTINPNSTAGQTPPAKFLVDNVKFAELSPICNQQLSSSNELPDNDINSLTDNPNDSGNLFIATPSSSSTTISQLGKIPPFWIPDIETNLCMQCKLKFTLLKRRHHCRACGQVLCSVCCSKKSKLQFLGDTEVRICINCDLILNSRNKILKNDKELIVQQRTSDDNISDDDKDDHYDNNASGSISDTLISDGNITNNNTNIIRSPNPNNPMEYCSIIPPHEQIEQQNFNQNNLQQNPISVMVPVGVLKREGVLPKNPRKDKNVIFSDGIRPGCDLADLDNNWDDGKVGTNRKFVGRLPTPVANSSTNCGSNNSPKNRNKPSSVCDESDSFIPKNLNGLPPIYCKIKTEYEYKEIENNLGLIERLKNEMLKFAIQRNFYVYVKIVTLKCCINKTIINFTTFGMHHVGQDEIIILLEMNDKLNYLPKDIFIHLNEIYRDADRGQPIIELGFSMPKQPNFLGSREHGGFLYIRPTFQCLQEIYIPESPFLIGILIHRWEVPWAKIFPLRLMLRLGAQYRYYPSPHISICERNSVYAEIAQTIINFLADFRNYTYTLATIKGMYIHMEDRKTSILIPKNRYDQIIKALNNSSDHILALGANFSKKADGHLVCIQNMESNCADTHTYSTQAINIQGQQRKITGASFVVLNGALKTTSGLSGKCSIVEDGLMVQILPQKMQSIRTSLKNMKDIDIICGPINADETQTEIVCIKWTDNDTEFNVGVESPIDGKKMNGIPSIRVHSGFNYSNTNHFIRWTEVFIINSGEESPSHGKDPIDISKLSEQIARSASMALSTFLDLLAANGYIKIGLRVTLNQDNVCFEAGSNNTKLAPLYMNALDNELIPILHKQTSLLEVEVPIIVELIFHILDK